MKKKKKKSNRCQDLQNQCLASVFFENQNDNFKNFCYDRKQYVEVSLVWNFYDIVTCSGQSYIHLVGILKYG